MRKGQLKLNRQTQRHILRELLVEQPDPVAGTNTEYANESQALWLSPEIRSAYFREQRIRRLQRLDALRAQAFEMELMPRVAAAESDYMEVTGKDFCLEIQALRAEQQLSADDVGWILTLEIGAALSDKLEPQDFIQLLDDQGRVWCRLPYREDRTYIFTWQQDTSPMTLLGGVKLYLQIL